MPDSLIEAFRKYYKIVGVAAKSNYVVDEDVFIENMKRMLSDPKDPMIPLLYQRLRWRNVINEEIENYFFALIFGE